MHPNFSEKAFKRYEQVIRTIVLNFPKPVWYDPAPFAVMTFSCRLRDAMRGLIEHHYDASLRNQLVKFHSDVVVAIRGNLIVIGDKDTVKQEQTGPRVQPGQVVSAQVMLESETIDGKDHEVVEALCLLAERRILSMVKVTGISEEQVREIGKGYDIETMQQDGAVIIL